MATRRPLSVVELYAGTARSAEPFYEKPRRYKVSLLVDAEPYAAQTYLANQPEAPYVIGDLARLSPARIKKLAGGHVDVLLGCPPCQGFSEVGFRDPEDPRNSHLTRFAKFVEALKPMATAIENVPLAADMKQFEAFTRTLTRLGYRWKAGIVNSALYGSAQCRQRLVVVGFRGDLQVEPEIDSPTHGSRGKYFSYRYSKMMKVKDDPTGMLGDTPAAQRVRKIVNFHEIKPGPRKIPTVESALKGLPPVHTREATALSHIPWEHTAKVLRRMGAVKEGRRWKGGDDHFSQSYGRLHRRGLARTITTYFANPGSGRYWHPTRNRSLTLREAARLQGFPDTFRFIEPIGRAATKLVGNALDARVAELIFRAIDQKIGPRGS